MEINVVEQIINLECDALIIAKFVGEPTVIDIVNKYAPEAFEGKIGQMYTMSTQKSLLAKEVIAVGFGKENDCTPDIVRQAIAKAIRHCKKNNLQKVAIDIKGDENILEAAVMGASIANYSFDMYKNNKENRLSVPIPSRPDYPDPEPSLIGSGLGFVFPACRESV